MNPSSYWQNPFVDVFKHFKVHDMKNADKKGRVTVAQDKDISRKIIKVEGQVSAQNYLQIPGNQSNLTALSLIGNYIYIQMHVPAGSIFAVHIVVSLDNQRYKLSFSNFYKGVKKQGDKELLVSIKDTPNKWGILCIDSMSYLQVLSSRAGEPTADYSIKSIQLCSNAKYKTIFTSNNLYNCENMPREMNLPLPKGVVYLDRYVWIFLSHTMEAENDQQIGNQQKKQTEEEMAQKKAAQQLEKGKEYLKSILKKKVQIAEPPPYEIDPEVLKENPYVPKPTIKNYDKIPQNKEDGQVSNRFEKEQDDNANNQQEVPVVYESHFQITPTPIMRLSHVHGYRGAKGNLCPFGREAILYSSGSVLILQDIKTREQKYMFGQNSTIEQIVASYREKIIITADSTQICFWNPDNLKRTGFYYTGYTQIISIDIAFYKKELFVALAGFDSAHRPGIMIIKGESVIVKHLSNFDIVKIGFVDKRDIAKGLVSIGKENIRFWWMKGKKQDTVLSSHSTYLGEHARDNIFTDFVIAQTDHYAFRIMAVANTGNLYVVDSAEKEIIGVFMIHDEPIRCINLHNDAEDANKQYVITCSNNGKVKVWKLDFSQLILEVKLDSQVCSLSVNDFIVCGCLNGTIGALSVEKKKFTVMIRSHSDNIIDMKYHKSARKILTISEDFSIRIWDLMKLKGSSNIFFQQVYEFRCLDEQVTCIQPFRTRNKFICGFQSGSVRVFDIANFSVACELNLHKKKVLTVDISSLDKFGLSADEDKVAIFNEQFQCIKEISIPGLTKAGFDLAGEYFYAMPDAFCIELFALSNFELHFALNSQEEIEGVRFSAIPEDLIVFTGKAKVKKYKIMEDEIKLFREYVGLHKGEIKNLTISANAQYVFTAGSDSLFKIWDYHFRGGMNPAFQAYNCGEPVERIVCSDDELNLVFAYGKESKGLYCWKFQGDLEKETQPRPVEEDLSKKIKQEADFQEKEIFSNLSARVEGNNYIEEVGGKNKQQETGGLLSKPIRGLYDEIQQNMNIADVYDLKQIQKQPIFNTAPPIPLENANSGSNSDRELIERAPGQYLDVNCVVGISTKAGSMQERFIWNQKARYLVTNVSNYLVVTHMRSAERDQKVIQLDSIVSKLEISPNGRYYVAALVTKYSSVKIFDGNSHTQIKELHHPQECFLHSVQISPCSNYLLTVITLQIQPQQNSSKRQGATLINIWELASGRLVSGSTLDEKHIFQAVRWNNVTLGALEFAVVYKSSLQFWRLNTRMTLENQQADITAKNTGNLQSVVFLSIEKQQKHLALVGTSTGGIIVFDIRSGSMICLCQQIINQPITEILVLSNNIILLSNTVNLYRFDLTDLNQLDVQKLAGRLSSTPQIFTLDSYPVSYSSSGDFEQLNIPAPSSFMCVSKCGVLWLVDIEDGGTLRVSSTHQSDKSILVSRYVPLEGQNGLIVSASTDSTLKIWELDTIEEKTEFFAPKKECLCLDYSVQSSLLFAGYSDGFLRVYNYRSFDSLGSVFIHREQQQNKPGSSVVAVKALPNTKNLLAANSLGDVYIVIIETLKPFSVQLNKIADNLGETPDMLALSIFDPLSLWLATTKDGKIQVWSRKSLKRKQNPAEELAKIYELEYYLIDNFKIVSSSSQPSSSRNSKKLLVDLEQGCQAVFSKSEKDEYLVISQNVDFIQFRNFREHINVRQIALLSFPKRICLNEKGDMVFIALNDGSIGIYDEHNGIELERQKLGDKCEISDMQVFDEYEKTTRDNNLLDQNAKQNTTPYLLIATGNQLILFNLLK